MVHLLTEGSLVNRTDLQALNLSGTYCHKTDARPPSCAKPRQPTIYHWVNVQKWNDICKLNLLHARILFILGGFAVAIKILIFICAVTLKLIAV